MNPLLAEAQNVVRMYEAAREDLNAPEAPETEKIADLALALASANAEILEALEGLKTILREDARTDLEDGETQAVITFPASTGKVTVTFEGTVAKIRKGADLERLRTTLGATLFATLFDAKTVYSPSKGFRTALEGLSSHAVRLVLNNVTLEEATPRVGFHPEKETS